MIVQSLFNEWGPSLTIVPERSRDGKVTLLVLSVRDGDLGPCEKNVIQLATAKLSRSVNFLYHLQRLLKWRSTYFKTMQKITINLRMLFHFQRRYQ